MVSALADFLIAKLMNAPWTPEPVMGPKPPHTTLPYLGTWPPRASSESETAMPSAGPDCRRSEPGSYSSSLAAAVRVEVFGVKPLRRRCR
jgi:hypothetical protein